MAATDEAHPVQGPVSVDPRDEPFVVAVPGEEGLPARRRTAASDRVVVDRGICVLVVADGDHVARRVDL